MKIFITGASGFVGGVLTKDLSKDHQVYGMARSERSAAKVREFGGEPVDCNLENISAEHMQGMDIVIHCAAFVEPWGKRKDFWEGNVEGTRRTLEAAEKAGVKRFIHMGTEAAVFKGEDLKMIDETYPYPSSTPFLYSETKMEAEKLVLAANKPGFETISLRPRLIWGPEDTTILPNLIEMVDSGKFKWIGHGEAKTSSCHVKNLAFATRLALEKGKPGNAYFITDGEHHSFKYFLTMLLGTAGRTPQDSNLPAGFAKFAAWGLETAWKTLGMSSKPPATRFSVAIMTSECTLVHDKACKDLGYSPVISVKNGMAEMAEMRASTPVL